MYVGSFAAFLSPFCLCFCLIIFLAFSIGNQFSSVQFWVKIRFDRIFKRID